MLSERERRWSLVLGGKQPESLSDSDEQLDYLLRQLYEESDPDEKRGASLSSSAPRLSRWLGDVRERFPKGVVRLMQKDAFQRLNLHQMLLQPEMLEQIEPDIHMLANLMSLRSLIPEQAKDSARQLVAQIVADLLQRLQSQTEQAIRGSLNRAARIQKPRHSDIDWARTIKANLRHYQPELGSIIPERLIGFGRKRPNRLKQVMLCVDQSGSMATSVIYASIFAAVMASIPALKTQLVVFDTLVVDLTEQLQDPIDVLFGIQLGGGTDINSALAYCQQRISAPQDTSLILITDLYEGGDSEQLLQRAAALKQSGVNLITLLALNDDGAPCFHSGLAQSFANLAIPTFACSPDQFPDLMAVALQGGSIADWAASQDICLQGLGVHKAGAS